MSLIRNCIIEKNNKKVPVWFMRQAGRYLPEFREIRKKNPNFIELCLNKNLVPEITLQPIKRFNLLDAAIIFSDILMIPHALGQKVEFKKDFGPILNEIDIDKTLKIDEIEFTKNLLPVYDSMKIISSNEIVKNKDTIGFIGAPWTLLVYMLNKKSPKKEISKEILDNKSLVKSLLSIIDKFTKLHIKNQIDNGAKIIQIFDSWAGLLKEENEISELIYNPTLSLVDYVKSLNTPVICFPRGIKNYELYCKIVSPDVINIDYEIDPKNIEQKIKIPVQGGLDPKILLTDKEILKKEALKYLNIFKDHPYIFNLGHGVLPETKPEMVEYLVNLIKDFK